jgi:amino acid permease
MSVALGAGMLALPSIFKKSGIIPGFFFIGFGAALSYIGLRFLLFCLTKTNLYSY